MKWLLLLLTLACAPTPKKAESPPTYQPGDVAELVMRAQNKLLDSVRAASLGIAAKAPEAPKEPELDSVISVYQIVAVIPELGRMTWNTAYGLKYENGYIYFLEHEKCLRFGACRDTYFEEKYVRVVRFLRTGKNPFPYQKVD